MKKIILSYCHHQGWGDSMISIFDMLNLTDFLRKKYDDLYVTLVINDIDDMDIQNVLDEVFDLNFFRNFFDEFVIQKKSFVDFNNFGCCEFNGIQYNRIYSGRNNDVKNNIPGIYNLYVEKNVSHIFEPNIDDYNYFVYDEVENKNIKEFPIFNKKVIDHVNGFISENFDGKFESVCYRANSVFDENRINSLLNKLDKNKTYFLSSNSSLIKEKMSKEIPNAKMIRGFDKSYNLSGCSNSYDDAFYSVCELYTLGESEVIYYGGELPWISLFVWYARNVRKVEIK
jgi:hypothetical protein